jgi:xanthine dehydrogenase YagT iron-sulfur-binding subunit
VTPPADGTALGPGPAPLQFTLNGEAKTVEAAPSATLADLLRHEIDATGTKVVCDRGACGACTVMIDGVARPSCMTLAHDVAGRRVTTVEGLAEGGELSALQAAFVRHDALQCGYCTSGMLMSCQALLSRTRAQALAADDVKRAISGNLCRCGTYPNVVAAVLSVADRKAG